MFGWIRPGRFVTFPDFLLQSVGEAALKASLATLQAGLKAIAHENALPGRASAQPWVGQAVEPENF